MKVNQDQKRSPHSICLPFIKILLFLFIVLFFTLSTICFQKATFHYANSNLTSTLSQAIQCPAINQTRVESGRKHFSHSRVIIAGLIRDREHHIPRLREQLSLISKLFLDYAIVIVENDSKDRTREELFRWANNDSHVHIVGCENPSNNPYFCNLSLSATKRQFLPEKSRIDKMVRLRNMYLNYIANHSQLNQYDYLLVEDFDLTTYTYIDGLYSTGFHLQLDPSIDAICSNGMSYNRALKNFISYENYFDPYAHKDRDNEDWSMAYNDIWSSLFRQYSCHEELVHVYSCFSGRTIYRYKSIRSKRYRTYLDKNQQAICEHVGFHDHFSHIYLNSEMLFSIVENNLIESK